MEANMNHLKAIKDYILFLKGECNLYVSLHPKGNEALITLSDLISFNIHDNPYCVFVKSFAGAEKHCVERQKKVCVKCKEGSFAGTCFAGVREFVYPITNNGEFLGFISVSGYKSDDAASYVEKASKKYGIPEKKLTEAYASLRDGMPEKERIDTLIRPLCSMLELAYIRTAETPASEKDPIERILRYVMRNHAQNITLEQICEHFCFSRSYISHRFKKKTGKSFREYLTEIRLEDAKSLLSYSNLNVTEIAFAVGFENSNYFSNVFKEHTGLSPTQYRKLKQA